VQVVTAGVGRDKTQILLYPADCGAKEGTASLRALTVWLSSTTIEAGQAWQSDQTETETRLAMLKADLPLHPDTRQIQTLINSYRGIQKGITSLRALTVWLNHAATEARQAWPSDQNETPLAS